MTVPISSITDAKATRVTATDGQPELGALRTERGSLPLDRIDVRADITGFTSLVELTQDFVNAFEVPLEATYVFPLPNRAAVTRMRITANGRVVDAELREREAARRAYADAVVAERRAVIAEEDRPDVFTLRVGSIAPGERVTVALTLVNPLSYEDGEATFRFPLVVAPRYIPGVALDDFAVGDGYADDTDAVPDASRITPPGLLPGFPHAVAVTVDVGIDPAGLTLSQVRSNRPAATTDDGRIRIAPGVRANQDLVLRLRYGSPDLTDSLVLVPDSQGGEGTFQLTVLPPVSSATPRPRDLVLVLDRSGSMAGWKMVAARRAAARIVDTLTSSDRFAVLTFGDGVDRPIDLPDDLVEASDRQRYRAVEHLSRVDAGGDTELLAPMSQALALLHRTRGRDAVLVLVTDGQVGNEDQLLQELSADLHQVRVHTVAIDQAANAGFLDRLARVGGGYCELVESEDRLDEAMHAIHRRIGASLARSLALHAEGLNIIEDTTSPARLPDLFPGVPLVVIGRYRGGHTGSLTVCGTTGDGADWSATVAGQRREAPAVTAQWARVHLRDLEDSYALAPTQDLAKRIVDTSLRFGVLCRFTAYVGLDTRDGRVVAEGGLQHRVLQPVEAPAGWVLAPVVAPPPVSAAKASTAPVAASGGKTSRARTVKSRNVIAVALVSLVSVLLLGTGWVWSLNGDGLPASTRDRGVVAGRPSDMSDATVPEPKGGLTENTVAAPQAPSPPAPPGTTYKRDIVTTGSLQMIVTEPTEVADRLVAAVTDAGGRVDSRSERSSSSSQSGTPMVDLVLRIPSDKLDGVLADAKKLGTVQSMSIGHTDVTSQRVDLDARIDALQTSVNRLLELMRRADDTADLLAAKSSLTQRQAELDSLRAQRATLGDEVAYATINVNLSVKPTVHRAGFLGALARGWQSLMGAAYAVLLAVGFLLPWLPLLAVVAAAIYFGVRVIRSRSPRAAGDEAAPS
ncbi:DUF4349 domain-containing protein [Mycobacterium simiae]|uniref:DUF4349 domain-containing protein n=1 Tax=Mycobacterium simiae TaxID=1784 RepID=A0A5B1BEP4_MYCSI|nr:DUF4349 domain-containing protein [Mycobacterium simiae]KAA1246876.1 DUF4349 domain-containing protein [Mycobacterium simiae]